MNVLTKDDAARLLNQESLDSYIGQLSRQLSPNGAGYSVPSDTAAKISLVKFLTYLLLQQSGVCVYIPGWTLHPSSEHLDLFYGYRRASGELRHLSEAPLHHFDP